MPDQQLVSLRPAVRRQQRAKVQLNLIRVVALGKAESLRQSADVGIHWKRLFTAQMDADHAGALVAHARKRLQLRAGGRDLSLVPLEHHFGSGDQIARLAAVQPTAFDHPLQLRNLCASVARRGWVSPKQSGRDQVHAAIGALSREDHRDQKLERGSVIQLDLRVGHVTIQPINDQHGSPPLILLGFFGHALSRAGPPFRAFA